MYGKVSFKQANIRRIQTTAGGIQRLPRRDGNISTWCLHMTSVTLRKHLWLNTSILRAFWEQNAKNCGILVSPFVICLKQWKRTARRSPLPGESAIMTVKRSVFGPHKAPIGQVWWWARWHWIAVYHWSNRKIWDPNLTILEWQTSDPDGHRWMSQWHHMYQVHEGFSVPPPVIWSPNTTPSCGPAPTMSKVIHYF